MRIFKKKQFNLLAVTITTLLLALTCGLTACGSKSSDPAVSSAENSRAENSGPGEAAETGSVGIPVNPELEAAALEESAELTMEDAQAKLICKNERWIAIAYYGPEDVRLSPCWNGTVDAWPFGQYGRDLSSGWTVAYMVRRPERGDSLFSQEELDGLGLNVKDRMDESSSVTFEHLEQMSETEMRAIGIPFLDGHKCLIENQTSVGSDNFCMIVSFSWLDEMSEADSEGFLDRVSFFAEDGAPLDDYFDGYTLEKELYTDITFTVDLYFRSSDSNKEQNETMIQKLKESVPYMIYTGLDGETVKTSLSWE